MVIGKDSVLRIEGHAVWQFINMFISLGIIQLVRIQNIATLYDKNKSEETATIKEKNWELLFHLLKPLYKNL